MYVHHCDHCGKKIVKDSASLGLGIGSYLTSHELCEECAAPITKILKRYKLTD